MCCTHSHTQAHAYMSTYIHIQFAIIHMIPLNRLNGVDYKCNTNISNDEKRKSHGHKNTLGYRILLSANTKPPIISRRNYISHNMSLDTHLSRLATCIIHKFQSLYDGSLSRMVSKYLDHTFELNAILKLYWIMPNVSQTFT